MEELDGNGAYINRLGSLSGKVIVATAKETASTRFDSSWYFDSLNGPAKVDPRHGGQALCLFADGHVEALDVLKMDAAQKKKYFEKD